MCTYVLCRTRPTFCVFLFWYRFQNKTTHFPRCKRNSHSDFFLCFSRFIRGLFFCAATSQHLVATAGRCCYCLLLCFSLCVYNFIHLFYRFKWILFCTSRAHWHTAPQHSTINSIPARRTHTHSHLLTETRVWMYVYVCMYICMS